MIALGHHEIPGFYRVAITVARPEASLKGRLGTTRPTPWVNHKPITMVNWLLGATHQVMLEVLITDMGNWTLIDPPGAKIRMRLVVEILEALGQLTVEVRVGYDPD